MQVSRRSAGGEALMTLTVDSPIQADVLHEAARDIGAAAASAVDLRDD
jgi:D-3-phosphoglycerate dehydrogenase